MKPIKNIKRLMDIIGKSATATGMTVDMAGNTCVLGGALLDCGMTEHELMAMSFCYSSFTPRAKELLEENFGIDEVHAEKLMLRNDSTYSLEVRRATLASYVLRHGDTFEELQDCVSETNRLKEPEQISALCGVEA